jgi:hypothetical protein
MFKNVASKVIAHGSFFIYTFRARVKQYYQIKIQRKHKNIFLHKVREFDENDVAIVALYPEKFKNKSTLRLLRILQKSRFNILIVLNQNSETENFLIELEEFKATILIRPNIGRDFGAYQAGTKYIQSLNLSSVDRKYLYVNDSVLYPPKFEKVFQHFLLPKKDWSTLFLNLQHHVHAQSFFFSLSTELFKSDEMKTFWSDYYPSNFRRHAIHKGEVELTQRLLRLGYSPTTTVDPFFMEKVLDEHELLYEEELKILEDSRFGNEAVSYRIMLQATNPRKFPTNYSNFLALRVQEILVSSNPTHVLGAYLTRVAFLPLKLDLIRHSAISPAQFGTSLISAGVDPIEVEEIVTYVMGKGSPASHRGLDKFWNRFDLS